MKSIIDNLYLNQNIDDKNLALLIDCDEREYLFARADERRREYYGDKVYIRGLIEFTNYCGNNCYYCGIRSGNKNAVRYRLSTDDILSCCKNGYSLGFRTFVLQGGEDMHFTDDIICGIVARIKKAYPDCAVTLSIGEKSYASYKAYFDAGADRFLLRHETADKHHYQSLHPDCMSLDNRIECLFNLKKIGYQVGSGFMVGSPNQTTENLVTDLRFLQELKPDMIGIGPFLPHSDTPFADREKGSMNRCLNLIAILRLMFPYALIPSTTALGTIHPTGRELGLKAGANVVMPNLSPIDTRKLYTLYNDKICTGDESAEAVRHLAEKVSAIGYRIVSDRGDAVYEKRLKGTLKP